MPVNQPTRIPRPFAESGAAATIPDVKTSFGEASWTEGFPTETGLPLTAGGIPPRKADFNGLYKIMSEHIRYKQSGGLYQWDNAEDYGTNAHIVGSDNEEYVAVKPSGPGVAGAGPQDPTLPSSAGYWHKMPKLTVEDLVIDGINPDGNAKVSHYCVCTTAADVAQKEAMCAGYVLDTGSEITVRFVYANTAATPTLDINGTGARQMRYDGGVIPTNFAEADSVYRFVYDGTYWCLVGQLNDAHVSPTTTTPKEVGTADAGTETKYARGDHIHPNTAPTPPAGDSSTQIATTGFVQGEISSHAIDPATALPLIAGTAAVGASVKYAREDHVHPAQTVPAASTVLPLVESGSGAIGSSTQYARADHVHPAGGGGGIATVSQAWSDGYYCYAPNGGTWWCYWNTTVVIKANRAFAGGARIAEGNLPSDILCIKIA